MKVFRISFFAGLIALSILSNSTVAHAQNVRNCAWPIEISPEGFGNALAPEALTRYFLIPFDTKYDTMTIKGTYPNVRYFSYVVYQGETPTDTVSYHLYDVQIAPDPGSVNPFVRPETSQPRTAHPSVNETYTVVISRTASSSGNTIGVPKDSFAWVMLRMYVPSADPSLSGQSLIGGVPLPAISLGGNELPLCSPVNELQDVTNYLNDMFHGIDALQGSEGTPSSDRLWFAAPNNPPVRLLPNPDNKYIGMFPGDNYQPDRLIVIRGKAPGTPYTYDGSPIWEPARGFRTIDMRYWTLCNNDLALPVPVVNCIADLTTDRQNGYYTIVISDDLLRPEWLMPNIDWLPWGDTQYPKLVVLRNMLPATNFKFSIQKAIERGCTFPFMLPNIPDRKLVDEQGPCTQDVMGEYYPVAAWCDKSTFVHGGWQACLKEQ